MASKKALTAGNLQSLGAERLAELLIDISAENAAVKRRIQLVLAAERSPGDAAKEIRKRLTAIARASSPVDGQNRKALMDDLKAQRSAIVAYVAKADPDEALDLMWQFLDLAEDVLARLYDNNGAAIDIFCTACRDLGEIAKMAKVSPDTLADRVFEALNENDYGQFDSLIDILAPSLGTTGLEHLKKRFAELSKTPSPEPPSGVSKAIGWYCDDEFYDSPFNALSRDDAIRCALEQIADVQGDVDGYIAQQSDKARSVPAIAVEIARRLLKAGRAEEAWAAINAIQTEKKNLLAWIPFEWEATRNDVLDALGRADEAQAFRWEGFERTLEARHLRAYLERLPDFDDFEAEERAFGYVGNFGDLLQALIFLVSWPALEKAATVVLRRSSELNGDRYEVLTPAAAALAGKHPLAATLVLRAMIDFCLDKNKVTRYRHAARHLAECASLAPAITDFSTFETHDAYVARLKAKHGSKHAFWVEVPL